MGAGILAVKCGPVFAGLTAGTIVGYTAYTLGVTQWRIQFRQAMNTADSEASARSTDSLINYETVKLYGNEAHERRRYDECLAGAQGLHAPHSNPNRCPGLACATALPACISHIRMPCTVCMGH